MKTLLRSEFYSIVYVHVPFYPHSLEAWNLCRNTFEHLLLIISSLGIFKNKSEEFYRSAKDVEKSRILLVPHVLFIAKRDRLGKLMEFGNRIEPDQILGIILPYYNKDLYSAYLSQIAEKKGVYIN